MTFGETPHYGDPADPSGMGGYLHSVYDNFHNQYPNVNPYEVSGRFAHYNMNPVDLDLYDNLSSGYESPNGKLDRLVINNPNAQFELYDNMEKKTFSFCRSVQDIEENFLRNGNDYRYELLLKEDPFHPGQYNNLTIIKKDLHDIGGDSVSYIVDFNSNGDERITQEVRDVIDTLVLVTPSREHIFPFSLERTVPLYPNTAVRYKDLPAFDFSNATPKSIFEYLDRLF